MKIVFNDILIRDAKKSDANILYKWWSDGLVMKHAGFPNGLETSIEKICKEIENNCNRSRLLIIVYKSVAIGEMNYKKLDDERVEIGIKICDLKLHDKGLGRVILSLLIKELFRMNYRKIVLDTNLNNTRAQHVYELLGFCKVNVSYNSWRDQLGQLQSKVNYELIESDFVDFTKITHENRH